MGVTDFSIEVDLETETNNKYWKNVDCKKKLTPTFKSLNVERERPPLFYLQQKEI